VIARIPPEKIDTPCRIGIADPISLQEPVRSYVARCDDIVGQLLKRGESIPTSDSWLLASAFMARVLNV